MLLSGKKCQKANTKIKPTAITQQGVTAYIELTTLQAKLNLNTRPFI